VAVARGHPEVTRAYATVGTALGNESEARVVLQLAPTASRAADQAELIRRLRSELRALSGAVYSVHSPSDAGQSIRLDIRGPDARTLAGVAQRVADEVRLVPGAVDVAVSTGGATIAHLDGDRVMSVRADVEGRPVRAVLEQIDQRLAAAPPPPEYRISHEEGAIALATASLRFLAALGIGVLMMTIVLGQQLDSVVDPLVILLALPLAAVAALGGPLVTGRPLTVPGLAGLILALGIAVRQATLLVTCARRRRSRGVSLRVALIEAGRVRLRPILVTSLALAVGVGPLASRRRRFRRCWWFQPFR
jgi:multidrug efflux pump subunit AcrB